MNELQDWKRIIDTGLLNGGFKDVVVRAYLDGENKVVVHVTHEGRTAEGTPDLVLSAIEEVKAYGDTLTRAFDARNMYGETI